jgi:hypothetical protein
MYNTPPLFLTFVVATHTSPLSFLYVPLLTYAQPRPHLSGGPPCINFGVSNWHRTNSNPLFLFKFVQSRFELRLWFCRPNNKFRFEFGGSFFNKRKKNQFEFFQSGRRWRVDLFAELLQPNANRILTN